ncbi:LLM class flavin-dependent oxidoreductase [Micromonospora sp. NPDC003816]|uniref:LLM class flavin-dependent oxidoreductase n=1 Tax=Micromonospora sp. NPDC003816 TaxID=3364224 RepID=UPI0036831308
MSVRIGIRLPACRPVDQLARAAQRAEELGFDEVWVPDSQLLWRDVFATLTAMALRTERLRLGTAVTNVETRHPSVVASGARTVAEAAPGRFVLGVGVGNSAVEPVGLRSTTQANLRERLGQVRDLLGGAEVDFGPVRSRLRDPDAELPVFVAASGPKNLRLAGEIADGVILLSGVSPATLTAGLGRVREGAEASGRSLADLEIVVSAYCHVTDDVEADARMLKPICAGIAQKGGAAALALAGIDVQVPPVVPGLYPDTVHAEDWAEAVRVCGQWITDEMAVRFARAFCLFGTTAQIAARIDEVAAAGATNVFLQHVGSYDLPYELMESFADNLSARERSA